MEDTGNCLQDLSVLIADDNANMRTLLRSMLVNFGIREVHEAACGQKAFDIFKDHEIDLVLCDINMTPGSGYDLLQNIRKPSVSRDPYVPVIIITGYAEPEYIRRARDIGMNEFMVKPITASALKKRIEAIITNPRPFIYAANYFGPDRRRQDKPYVGPDRRKS